ncbi:MAG: hypothetical protein JW934_07710 [Anaerolineae bacterium]|nr:hypothetical protein [Anaerolineae bacterium]
MAELETQMTLEQVARRYGVAHNVLIQMAQDGIIKAAKENDKETPAVTVSDIAAAANTIREEIKPEQYEHLRGQQIRLLEASRELDVDPRSLMNWANYGYIHVHDHDKLRMEIDQADAAYVVAIFKRAINLTGSPIRAGWVLKRLMA